MTTLSAEEFNTAQHTVAPAKTQLLKTLSILKVLLHISTEEVPNLSLAPALTDFSRSERATPC